MKWRIRQERNDMNIARTELYRELPLDTPYSIHIFPSFHCNFSCNYCLHSLDSDTLSAKGFHKQYMDWELFRKTIDDAQMFPGKIRALIFAGHGEPLLHRNLVDMVAYAKRSGKFERIEVVTNGSLLKRELSDGLIAAGLDRLRISLQGVNAAEYQEISNVKLDFSVFVDQLRYFYEHKLHTEVYIKIIDVALKNMDSERKFRDIFEPISDIAAVEYAIPFVKEIDYSNVGELSRKCKQGHGQTSQICSMPFYMLTINPDGSILPCCSTDSPLTFGNIENDRLTDIWNSEQRNLFLRQQLNGAAQISICSSCSVPAFGLQLGDYLDGHEVELMERFSR